MKILSLLVGAFGLLGHEANATEAPFQIHCNSSTRAISGILEIEVDPAREFLGFSLERFRSNSRLGTEYLSGSNQEGFGRSSKSTSSVVITRNAVGDLKIVALGRYYDRASLIGGDEIKVLLKKEATDALGGYTLDSFVVNGKSYHLGGLPFCSVF